LSQQQQHPSGTSRGSILTQHFYIPTPEAATLIEDYGQLYEEQKTVAPKAYRKHLATIDELASAFPHYNVDDGDLALMKELKEKGHLQDGFDALLFERIIDCFEEAAHRLSEQIVSSASIERLRCDGKINAMLPSDEVIEYIIEYWRKRRAERGLALLNLLRHEDLGKLGSDPYVCFRRRELKVPRKTRKSDAQITDRLKKLHYDLAACRAMLQAAVRRDQYKREALLLEEQLFERYRQVDGWRKHNRTSWPAHLPTFKTAAQSLLEAKKKRGVDGGDDDEEKSRIAIPVSVLSLQQPHCRPYYGADLARTVQKEMEAMIAPDMEDLTGELSDDDSIELRLDWWGRIVQSQRERKARPMLTNLLSDEYYSRTQSRLLGPRDIAQLQTPVGNYNVHAVQTANQIIRPMSHQAWLAATAPIVQSMLESAAVIVETSSQKGSPKKKRKRKVAVPLDEEKAVLSSPIAAVTGEIPKQLSLGSQITVKVKSRTESPLSEEPTVSLPSPSNNVPRTPRTSRFTMTGLANDSH